jgi:hypothetical protein
MKIVAVVILSLAIALALTIKPTQPPARHHIYYCLHPHSGSSFPCKFRQNEGRWV